jgi:hypothetical protein
MDKACVRILRFKFTGRLCAEVLVHVINVHKIGA